MLIYDHNSPITFPHKAVLLLALLLSFNVGVQSESVRALYYRAGWFGSPSQLRLDGITHLYHFAGGINTVSGEMTRPDANHLKQVRDYCRARNVKFIGVVMNFNRNQFMSVVGDNTKRQNLVKSIGRWYREERLDGVDIDFEHPSSPTDTNLLGALMTELRAELGNRAILCYAMAQWNSYTHVPSSVINESMDIVNIMSYDHGGEHASWTWAINDMQFYKDRGVIDSRLVLGVPFYSTHTTNRDSKTYGSLLGEISYTPGEYQNTINGYYFNSRGLIYNKAHLSHSRGSGIFAWTIDQDVSGTLSLRDAMIRGSDAAQAMLDGFEYPPYAKPPFTLGSMTTESSHWRRTGGLYGCRTSLNFSGQPWNFATMTSPQLPEFSIPSNSTVKLDVYVENPAGALLIRFFDADGRELRAVNYSLGSTGWKSIRVPRSSFTQQQGSFDFDRVTKWQLYVEGTNGGSTVAPYTRNIVFDTFALYGPGGKRPKRLDHDSNMDTVPDLSAAGVCWVDRFRHGNRTTPDMIYTYDGNSTNWRWADATYYPGQKVIRGSISYTGASYGYTTLTSPAQSAYAVNPDSTLHFELDVLTATTHGEGTLRVDIIDADGNSSKFFDYGVLNQASRKFFDIKASRFTGTADLSRLTKVQFIFEGNRSSTSPFSVEVELANLCWGRLPIGHAVKILDSDQDNDGLSDAAEDRNLNGLVDSGETSMINSDTDGDGDSDGTEYGTGTDPLDSSQMFFLVLDMSISDNVQLTWPSKPGANYRIESSTTLANNSWVTIVENIAASNIGNSTTHTLTKAAERAKHFYRVKLK